MYKQQSRSQGAWQKMFVNIKMNLCAAEKFLIKWKTETREWNAKRNESKSKAIKRQPTNHWESKLEQRACIFEAMFEQSQPNLFAYLILA